jgi:arylsulfatase A-like enzyme
MTNIALVVLDTLRKDAFDRHFDWLPGRRFECAYSTANWTVPAHASLFTGKYASEVGVHAKNMYCDCSEPTLAEQLREAGYTTRGFSANTNITGHFDFDRGFSDLKSPKRFEHLNNDYIFDWRTFNRGTTATGIRKYLRAVYECAVSDSATIPSLKAGARAVFDENSTGVKYGGLIEARDALSEMRFGDQEFLFINVMEAHEPYRVPSEYRTVEEPSMTDSVGDITVGSVDAERTKQAYDDCVKYLSNEYERFFETLQRDFDYIITLSDHGEMLGESDAWGHEYGVYPELMHVPLCISGDGIDGTYTETVNLIDVHETVLDMAGLATESEGYGQSLVGDVEGKDRLTEYLGLTSWSEKKIEEHWDEQQVDRYDEELRGYAATEDYYGYETLNGFSETGAEELMTPRDRLDKLVSDLDVRQVKTDNEVPEEIKDQLEHLGYA